MTRRIAIALSALLIFLSGCSEETPAESTTSPLENAASVYQKAYDDIKSQKHISVTVQHNRKTLYDGQTFLQSVESEIIYNSLGTTEMSAKVSQKQTFGSYEFTNELVLIDGTGYYNIAGGKFQNPLSEADFIKEYPFLLALSPALYKNIQGTTDGTSSSFTFKNATGVEQWLDIENASVENASGGAIVNDGKIISCEYTAKYKQDTQTIEDVITVHFDYSKKDIEKPKTDHYIASAHPEALLLIEQAVGNLRQADLVSSSTEEVIACKAYNEYQDVRTQRIQLHLRDTDRFLSRLNITTSLSSRGGEPTNQTQQISFIDGEYTTSMNSEEPVVQKDISEQQMKAYCTEYLESTIMMAKHITDVQITETADTYLVEFSSDNDMAENLRKNVCYTLYTNEDVFASAAELYKVNDIGGSVVIDKKTNLPISSEIHYTGTYHISGHAYELSFKTQQNYSIPSEEARNIDADRA